MMRRMMIAALLACTAVPAWAQAPTGMFSKLTVGCVGVPASTSTMRICGSNPTRSGGQSIVSVDGSGNTTLGALVAADIPSTFTQRNVAEAIASPWTFSGGLTGPLNVTNSLSSPIGTFSTRVRTPLVDTASGPLTLQGASGVVQFGSNTTEVLPPSMQAALGSPIAPWLSFDVMEMRASILVNDERMAFTGGSAIWSRGTALTRPVTAVDSVIYTKHRALRYNDVIILRDVTSLGLPQFEAMRICSATGEQMVEGDYLYCVARNIDGTGANAWEEGSAVVSTDRLIDMYSYSPTTLSYWGSVLSDRPLLAFNFNATPSVDMAGTGAAAALGSGALTGAGSGTSAPGIYYRAGSAGETFSGINPGTALNGVSGTCALTVEMWVRLPDGGFSATQAYVVQKGSPGSSANHFSVLHTNTGRLYMLGAPGGVWGALTPQTPVFSSAAYVHLAFVWDASMGGRTYVNGVDVGTTSPAAGGCLTPNASTIQGAGQWASGTGFGISELAVYGYPLTQQQIRAHYEALNSTVTSMHHGPTVAGRERTGTGFNDISTRWALGQLQGIADYQTPTMGFWAGDQAATWVSADAANGFRIGHGSAIKLHAKTNGDLDLSGNLNLVTGGNVTSTGNWSITQAGGFLFGPSVSSSGDAARSVRWSNGASLFSETSLMSAQIHRSGAAAIELRARNDSLGVTGLFRINAPTLVGDAATFFFSASAGAVVRLLPGTTGIRTIGSPTSAQTWTAVYATTYHAGATAGYSGTCTGNPVVSGGIVIGCS